MAGDSSWFSGAISSALGAGVVAVITYFSQKSLEFLKWKALVIETVFSPILRAIEDIRPDLTNVGHLRGDEVPRFFMRLHHLYCRVMNPRADSYYHIIPSNIDELLRQTRDQILAIVGGFIEDVSRDSPQGASLATVTKYRDKHDLDLMVSRQDNEKALEHLRITLKELSDGIHFFIQASTNTRFTMRAAVAGVVRKLRRQSQRK